MSATSFDIEAYMAAGMEGIVKDILKTSIFCPEEALFMGQYALASKKANRRREELYQQGKHVPPFLICSITSVCNLHCAGCYARSLSTCEDGTPVEQLTAADWGEIFQQARDIGVGFILLAGGEPIVRMDVLEQAGEVPQILFPVFTNGTLMQEKQLKLFDAKRNLIPILSLEGDEAQTDKRRGKGVYARLMQSVERMNSRHIAFGASITVTRENMELVTDPAYISAQVDLGFKFFILVEYVPTSKGTEHLAPDDAMREVMFSRVMDLRQQFDKALFITFPGDEKTSDGCLAAGRGFFHINSHGGAEPCPFSPYSDINLKTHTLLDVVDSPLFHALRDQGLLLEDHAGGCVLYERREQVEAILLQHAPAN